MIYDPGRHSPVVDGKPEVVPTRYKDAVLVESGPTAPAGPLFSNNLFHPGTPVVSTVEPRP